MDVKMGLYKIADALQMPLVYENKEVSGSTTVQYSAIPCLRVDMRLKVLRLFVNEVVGVMSHISDNLYIVITYFGNTGVVSALLVDSSKLPADCQSEPQKLIGPKFSGREVVATLRQGIVASFCYRNLQWATLKLPD